jgi:rhodanese-related sulfurtransferase
VARQLIQAGYENVYALKGGWQEWQARGYPTDLK